MITYKDLDPVSLYADIPIEARAWRNNYEIRKWCRQHTLITQEQHDSWHHTIQEHPSIKMFGVVAKGEYVGVAGLTSICEVNRNAEFSLYIVPKQQKKGYGKKALIALLRHGFDNFNLNRIWGETFAHNPAHTMFLELGLKDEGTFRQSYFREGKYINSHIVAVLREEFKHQAKRLQSV